MGQRPTPGGLEPWIGTYTAEDMREERRQRSGYAAAREKKEEEKEEVEGTGE